MNDSHIVAGGNISIGDVLLVNSAGVAVSLNEADQPPLGIWGVEYAIGYALESHSPGTPGAGTIRIFVQPHAIHYGSGD